ncbi:MAG: hypothetical protein JKX87_07430 [Cycloclasticus sp.]|nr:hypothetical protein [Cycloclasticus sp.]
MRDGKVLKLGMATAAIISPVRLNEDVVASKVEQLDFVEIFNADKDNGVEADRALLDDSLELSKPLELHFVEVFNADNDNGVEADLAVSDDSLEPSKPLELNFVVLFDADKDAAVSVNSLEFYRPVNVGRQVLGTVKSLEDVPVDRTSALRENSLADNDDGLNMDRLVVWEVNTAVSLGSEDEFGSCLESRWDVGMNEDRD